MSNRLILHSVADMKRKQLAYTPYSITHFLPPLGVLQGGLLICSAKTFIGMHCSCRLRL